MAGKRWRQKRRVTGAKVGLSARRWRWSWLIGIFSRGAHGCGRRARAARRAALRHHGRSASELAWLLHPDVGAALPEPHRAHRPRRRALRRLAHPRHDPAVHVRRLRHGRVEDARSHRPGIRAVFGWSPGGLAIVCIVASAFSRPSPAGAGSRSSRSGAPLPGAPEAGVLRCVLPRLVTTGGSLGLLLPPSLPILVYSLVAGIDFNKTVKAGSPPASS